MERSSWHSKQATESYTSTKEFRFPKFIVNPHLLHLIGSIEGKSVFEVGCGFGRYLELLWDQKPSRLVGCDISANQIELASKNLANYSQIELKVQDFSCKEIDFAHHDIVFSVFVILYTESLERLESFINNYYSSLKSGGKAIICTLNIEQALRFPDVFNILNLPTKALTEDGKYFEGCKVQLDITFKCRTISFLWKKETQIQLMEKAGFRNVEEHKVFLDEEARKGFQEKELKIIKESGILLFLTGTK